MKYIFDGAFGTLYHARTGRTPEYAVVHEPEKTAAIHRDYLKAGATAIKTATFGVNFSTMPRRAGEIIAAAYKIAVREAESFRAETGVDATVFADIGQLSDISPDGTVTRSGGATETAAEAYCAAADVFMLCGAKHFLFETLTTAAGVAEAVRHVKGSIPVCEIIVSFAVGQDGYTACGEYYLTLIEAAHEAGADIVGLNCVCGPAHMLNLLRAVDCRKYKVTAMPNAGYPSVSGGRTVYNDAPEYFAGKLYEMCCLGIECAGGCCGTTPAHIGAFADMVKAKAPEINYSEAAAPTHHARTDAGVFSKSGKIIAVELEAPENADTSWLDRAAEEVKKAGADLITVPDSPMARVRADSVMTSARIKRTHAIDVLPHLSCRDRNQIALKGQLIAASLEGLRNILVMTGDSAARSGASGVKDVFGFDSTRFIAYINSLNSDIFAASPFCIGAALNTSAANFDVELERAKRKKAAGAEVFFTQPVYSDAQMENLRRAYETLDGCRVMAGIMPPAGYKNALFLSSEVAGIEIPLSLIDALKDAPPEEASRITVEFACSVADKCAGFCDGYYLMVPRRKTELVAAVIAHIKKTQGVL